MSRMAEYRGESPDSEPVNGVPCPACGEHGDILRGEWACMNPRCRVDTFERGRP